MKKSLLRLIIISLSFIAILTPSCKDKCKDINCQNGGDCIDGTCNCINGYTGKNCEIAPLDFEITVSPISGTAPLDIIATCNVKSGTIDSYEWDFGDNSGKGLGKSVSHKYNISGNNSINYRIVLTVTSKSPGNKTREQTIEVKAPPKPPISIWDYSPKSSIIADKTVVQFSNLSTGSPTSTSWNFGLIETSSNLSNPTYVFNYEGSKTVTLKVTNSVGTHSSPQTFTVHAMSPNCNNYTDGSTQSASKISSLRSAGLKTGQILINNNYAIGNIIDIELYHPDDWLNGKYSSFARYENFYSGTTSRLTYNGSNLVINNDWGIKVYFKRGGESCIRSVNSVSTYSNNQFTIKASNIYD